MNIGFIDYYLDEWHANNYPQMLQEASGGELTVKYAYAVKDKPNGMTTDEWCEKYGVIKCKSIEELVEKSDGIAVLSPDNCELHEELSRLPLMSKKPTYIDKTFAPTAAAAKRIFALGQSENTPCWSTSALRFAAEYGERADKNIKAATLIGPLDFETYSIHLLEPIMMLMKADAKRVIAVKGTEWHTLSVEFCDGRAANITQFLHGAPFYSVFSFDGGKRAFEVKSDYFGEFIKQLVKFYRTKQVPVPHIDTVRIMALREAGIKALSLPGQWIGVESSDV